MSDQRPFACTRRGFLAAVSMTATVAWSESLWADERPEVSDPRATSGDAAVEPEWEKRLAISVGPEKADVVGATQQAIQAAVDYVAGLGGGTVRILPGTYRLRNAVYLRSRVRIIGSGEATVLIKEPSKTTKLAADSDWFDQEITLADADGFEIGDGVCIRTKDGSDVVKRTLVARSGSRFRLDRALRKNFWRAQEAIASTLFPLFSGEEIADVAIEDLVLDGNKGRNENLNGNYAGCIFVQDCNRLQFRGLTTRNYDGDGISWQVCHDVLVENCHSHDNTGLGLHPGSGSQRPVIRNNRLLRNGIGLFFCWGVRHGLAEGNVIEDTAMAGISIGHHDTDNLVTGNTVRRSGKVGVLFRPERGKDFAGHRNRLEKNRIEDSGGEEGIGIDIQGGTEKTVLRGNQLVETRGPARRIGVRLGAETGDITLAENTIQGFAMEVQDLRKRIVVEEREPR